MNTPTLTNSLLEKVKNQMAVNRVDDLERLNSDQLIKGDFEGSVSAKWVRLAPNGAGIVLYNGKEYETKPIGFTSIAPGGDVELSHANGVYYSKW